MQNFTFYNPTKILFGEGQIANIQNEVPKNARVLMLYGGGSIKKNGVYDQVIAALKNHTVFEFNGIEPNPTYETCMQAVAKIKQEKIDYLLAVGGGSVVDGAKFIAAATKFEGDEPWDIIAKQAEVKAALPIGVVLTLPATGSESNAGAVVTRKASGDKMVFKSLLCFPRFAVLDPSVTYTLPIRQTRNGIVDAFTHTMEQYLTFPQDAPLQDRFAEGLLQTLIEEGPKVIANPTDYNARANVMWCATLALNMLIGSGVKHDWATHMIGHEITARHGLDHAQTLAIILPSVMQYKRDNKREKLLQYAERVWHITEGDDDSRIDQAIAKTRDFFESLGMKTRLHDYDVSTDTIPEMLAKLKEHKMVALGERQDITLKDSEQILRMSA